MSKLKFYAAVAIMAVLLAACVSVPAPVQPPQRLPHSRRQPSHKPLQGQQPNRL
jgi:PBP1b-binding outer membrane lipoprotein LpoB